MLEVDLVRYPLLPAVLLIVSAAWSQTPAPGVSLEVGTFGASCNWSPSTLHGSDDTAAFQRAADAATALYAKTGAAVEVRVARSCVIQGSIRYGSGVHWRGPGILIVPQQHASPTLVALNADDVSVEDLTVDVLDHAAGCGSSENDAGCVALSYQTTSGDHRKAHHSVRFIGNTVLNSNWGILVNVQAGEDTVSDIHVERNSVLSTKPYSYHDGIHVGGGVSLFTIANNNVFGRGDAAIAVSSEVHGLYPCSGGTISGNTLLEDLVGIDDSGCSDVAITGNEVRATTPVTRTSNPAFRSIFYNGTLPSGLTVTGNTFINYRGTGDDYAAKFDLIGSRTSNLAASSFTANTVGSLYTRGSGIAIQGNTFLDGASWNCDIDAGNGVPTDNILFGQNTWLGAGTANCSGNARLITNSYFFPQNAGAKGLRLNVDSMIQPNGPPTRRAPR